VHNYVIASHRDYHSDKDTETFFIEFIAFTQRYKTSIRCSKLGLLKCRE